MIYNYVRLFLIKMTKQKIKVIVASNEIFNTHHKRKL